MIILNIILLSIAVAIGWWLSGFDSRVTGENKKADFIRRFLRCFVTAFLAGIFFAPNPIAIGYVFIPLIVVVPTSLGLLWCGCLSELFSRCFRRLLDPSFHDERPLDLGKSQRYLDTIAHLIHNGQRDAAIKLCEELKSSDEVDILTLEHTLEFLGVKQAQTKIQKPVNQAAQLRAEGRFSEAEQHLKSLLVKNSADAEAAMLLMRLYAQDLRQPGKAHEILRQLEKQPHVAASHVEFARRSIDEWSRPKPRNIEVARSPKAESVEEMLEQKMFGSAIERLEEKTREQPGDFDLRLKLAEVHAVQCDDFVRAEKIIRRIAADGNFSEAQIAAGEAKLKEWREARLQRK